MIIFIDRVDVLMDFYELKCKGCGKKLLTYSQASLRKYESPLKSCPKCGMAYADPRCREIAVEGIPSDTFNIPAYVIMGVFGGLILYRGIHVLGMRQLGTPDQIQWLLPAMLILIGIILVAGGIIEVISITTGVKKRKYERLTEESEKRLADRNYAYTLKELGYDVPENYL